MKVWIAMNRGENITFFEIEGDAISVGRSSANDIQIPDKCVSRIHLIIWKEKNSYLLKDLGSENGTFVNGSRIPHGDTIELPEGHTIAVGTSVFCVGKGSSRGGMSDFFGSISSREEGESNTSTVILVNSIMAI